MSLFGSSGIRGVVGQEFTLELAVSIGAAVGSISKEIVLGRDTRTSGEMVSHALAAGITSVGGNVHDAGMLSTPTLARAAAAYDCGLMVTASHNPPQYNGVKMWNPDGSAFDSKQMQEVEDLILNNKPASKDWRGVGSSYRHEGAIQSHVNSILRSLPPAPIKVVLDCGNGGTSMVSPYVLRGLGGEVTSLNTQPDGYFPGRAPEPTEDQLTDLKETVLRKKAALGIAHDGDGDRMVAVDDRGRYVDGDRLLALFASHLGAKGIVAPMDASMVLDDIVKGPVVRCKVGDVYVAEALKEANLDFGGEPSGTYIFAKETYCPDGVYAGAMLATMVASRSLSEMLDSLPSYPSQRESFKFERARRAEVERCLADEMEGIECEQLLTLDGYRANFSDGWFLIRLSGTEPKVRVTAEARGEDRAKELARQAKSIVERCIR